MCRTKSNYPSNIKSMRVAFIAYKYGESLDEQLIPRLRERGHDADKIDVSHISLSDFDSDPVIQSLVSYDLIYYRTGLGEIGAFLLQQFLETHDKRLVNGVRLHHPFVNHKKYQVTHAARAGLPVPETFASASDSYEPIVNSLGSPFVAKDDTGAHGSGVHLIDTKEEFDLLSSTTSYIYQRYLAHPWDYRIFVRGTEPFYGFRRIPAEGEFRSNLSRGARLASIAPDKQDAVYALAARAAQAFEFDICGVDILESSADGSLCFLEINDNPGWMTEKEDGTILDLSDDIIDHLEKLNDTHSSKDM